MIRAREKTEKQRKRESEGLKARDGEAACGAIFGPSGCFLHTRSRFSGLLLFRTVGVESSDLIRLYVLRVCICVSLRALLISPGVFSCGCHGFVLCFEQLAITPNILRV